MRSGREKERRDLRIKARTRSQTHKSGLLKSVLKYQPPNFLNSIAGFLANLAK